MSKRQFKAACPSPNIVIIPTVTISGNDPSLPTKKPKLAETANSPIPAEFKVNLDTVPVPPPPLPKVLSQTVIESVNPIKKEVISVITTKDNVLSNCEPYVIKKSLETQVKELKPTARQPSWASNYLTSIGLVYNKPIKINFSKNKLNVELEELNKSKSTDDDTSKEIKDDKEEDDKCYELPPKSPTNETLVSIINPSNNEVIHNSNINPQPYLDLNYPEKSQIKHYPLYPNLHSNFQNPETMFTTTSLFEYDNCSRKETFHRPTEDKSYLDKVKQFLSKISQDSSQSHEYDSISNLQSKTRTRSFSLKNRDVTYTENPRKLKTDDKICTQATQTQLCDGKKQPPGGIKTSERDGSRQRLGYVKTTYDSDECNRYKSKSTEKYKNRPSTSKQIYYVEKEHKKYENSDSSEFTTKYNKLLEEFKRRENGDNFNIRSLRKYYREGATDYVPNPSLIHKTYKMIGSSDISSRPEFVRNQSYRVCKNQSNKIYTKREMSSSSSCSENNRERSSGHTYKINKKPTHTNFRDSSDSSSCSMPCCGRKINASIKHHSREKSNSSDSEIRRHRSPQRKRKSKVPEKSCQGSHTQKFEKRKSRRDRSNNKRSEICDTKLSCQSEKTKMIEKRKLGRERSISSSNSESCQHKLPCHAHRIQEKKKRKLSNSSSNSEKSRSSQAHKHKEKSVKRVKTKSNHRSSENNKTSKVMKDVISKDRIRKTVTKSSTCNNNESKESSNKDKYAELKLALNSQKTKSQFATIHNRHNRKGTSIIQENNIKDLAPIKSVVQIKDQPKSRHNMHVTEKFDLRSKLSRKTLSQHFSKICKTNSNTESKINEHEKIFITVANQNEDKEKITATKQDEAKQKIFITAKDKLIEISQRKRDNNNIKKHRKYKVVLKVICETSQSDSDDVGETTSKNSDKECKDDIIKKVVTENNLSDELSFLDDLNIDEIVDILKRDNNESCSLNNTTCATITVGSSSSSEIDTYDLVSDSENSDASTVLLEELGDTHDNLKTVENSNTDYNSQRILNEVNKLDTGNENINIKSEKKESDQSAMMCEYKIKEEISYVDNNDLISQRNDERIHPMQTNFEGLVTNIERSFESKKEFKEAIVYTNDNIILGKKIKEEPAVKGYYEVRTVEHIETNCNLISTNHNKEKSGDEVQSDRERFENKNKETERSNVSTHDLKILQNFQQNAVLVNKVKEEPAATTLFLDSSKNPLELSSFSPNELKKHMPNYVLSESSMQNEMGKLLKNNSKENTSQVGDEKNNSQTELITLKEIKKENAEKTEKNHYNNLSTGVDEFGSVTNTKTQSKVDNNDKNIEIQKKNSTKCITKHANEAIVKESMTISESIYLTQEELHDIKEEPGSDTENGDGSIISLLPKTNTPVPTNSELISNKESEEGEHMPSSIIEIKSNKEVSNNTYLQTKVTHSSDIQKNTDLDRINLPNTNHIKKANDIPVPLKTSEYITKFKSATNTELKLNGDTEPKNEVSETIKSDNSHKLNVVTVNASLKLEIESGKNKVSENTNNNSSLNKNVFENTNTESSLNKNFVSNSDKKKLKLQEQPKPTSNVVKKKKIPEKETAMNSQSLSHIRVELTQTKSHVKSDELALSPRETATIGKIEDRLLNYLGKPYTVDSILHRGRFSKIFKCSDARGQNYVVKLINKIENDRHHNSIAKEKMLNSLQRDIPEENLNFVRFFNGLEVSRQWCFLMEYYPKNLSQVLKENKKSLYINTVQLLSRQLVAAVTVLRYHNVVHSDIKPEHVLLNNANDRLKLCGFDIAYYVENPNLLPSVGTISYRAPEIILGYSSGFSIDVWSTALVMYQMATRRHLFPGMYNNDILFKQICTRGYIPIDMISRSRFAYKHFQGTLFKRRIGPMGQNIVFVSEHQIYRNNFLEKTIRSTYYKEWGVNTPRNQKREEALKMVKFLQLLEQMLVVHPNYRLPIERVYTHPFLFDYSE